MERSRVNTTPHQNQSDFWNGTEELYPSSDRAFTNISLSLGSCITIINVTTLCLLMRHRRCIEGTGFWQQLLFLCSTDILTGISIVFPPLGYFFFDINTNIYYLFCVFGIFVFPLSFTLSAGNCCIISIYRYVILRYIVHRNTTWRKYGLPLMLLGNGLLCILTVGSSVLVVSTLFGFQYKELCNKVDKAGQNEYKSTYVVGPVIMLAIFLVGTNVFTITSLVYIRNMNRIQPTNDNTTQLQNIMKRNRYASVTFILIVSVLNLTTIPTLLFFFVSMNSRKSVSADTIEIISRLFCFNSLLNPFIYCLRSTAFRTAVWKDIRAVISRLRCSHHDGL